ncbi:lipase member I-like [Teleopsis dalmanni]|uniref:lipase member I-like n=1 Tax=Teleopsis dalmanni TaxID=139649 RepID=UPI0018CD94D1|nr:lipase member I-like [Teleopsis dalmanni]
MSHGYKSQEALLSTANIYYQKPLSERTGLGEPSELTLDKVEDLISKQNLKIIVHGYLGSRTHSSIKPLVKIYLAQGAANIFIADWQYLANLDYRDSRRVVSKVSMHFAEALYEFFNKHEIDYNEVHIIGHSLGAHIAGNIGRFFNGSFGRVTGLDPALPLFTPFSLDGLRSTDAQFVDVIHTDFPVYGDLTPRGTVDFYPNFGYTQQKGCNDMDLLTTSKILLEAFGCSHSRAVVLYAESIEMPKNFPALPCPLSSIQLRNLYLCLVRVSLNDKNLSNLGNAISEMDETQVVYMGEEVSRSATGYYYLETNDAPPYGMGAYTKFSKDSQDAWFMPPLINFGFNSNKSIEMLPRLPNIVNT